MVAETNDVWYWNHPNIDYWVSQQSLVYIKHSPVTGWPAGVILIIRRRNMACSARRGHETQLAACCLLHLAPGLPLTCLFLMKAFWNFTRYELTHEKRVIARWFNISRVSQTGPLMQTILECECRIYPCYPIAIRAYKSLHWYSMEWAGGELRLAGALLGLDWLLFPSADWGMTSCCFLRDSDHSCSEETDRSFIITQL